MERPGDERFMEGRLAEGRPAGPRLPEDLCIDRPPRSPRCASAEGLDQAIKLASVTASKGIRYFFMTFSLASGSNKTSLAETGSSNKWLPQGASVIESWQFGQNEPLRLDAFILGTPHRPDYPRSASPSNLID